MLKLLGRDRISEDAEIQELHELHDFSEQLFLRREESGLTQQELARRAGMTQAQIATIEAGTANPTLRTMTKLAHALGCRIREMFEPVDAVAGDVVDDRTPAPSSLTPLPARRRLPSS
jgi:transcriptional regulator with XRE-family HTH domain